MLNYCEIITNIENIIIAHGWSGQDTEDSTFEYSELDNTDDVTLTEKFETFVNLACSRPLVTPDQCVKDEEEEDEEEEEGDDDEDEEEGEG